MVSFFSFVSFIISIRFLLTFAYNQAMSSISIETYNENQLTVEEYVRYIKIRDGLQHMLDNAKIKEALREAEESLMGLNVDMTVKYSFNRKKY